MTKHYIEKQNEIIAWFLSDVKDRAKEIANRKRRINGKMTLKVNTKDLASDEVDSLVEYLEDLEFCDIVENDPHWCDESVLVEEATRKDGEVAAWKYVGFCYDEFLENHDFEKTRIDVKRTKDGLEIKVGFYYWYEIFWYTDKDGRRATELEFDAVKKNLYLTADYDYDDDDLDGYDDGTPREWYEDDYGSEKAFWECNGI